MRASTSDTKKMAAKKKLSREKMIERYHGKNDLLATWDEHPDLDREYRADLKQRVHYHQQAIVYRGVPYEEFEQQTTRKETVYEETSSDSNRSSSNRIDRNGSPAIQ
jgi:hypothetical protein